MAQKKPNRPATVPGTVPAASPAGNPALIKRSRKTINVTGEDIDLSQVEDLQPLGTARSPYDRELQYLQAHAGTKGRTYAAEVMPGLKTRALKLGIALKVGWKGGDRKNFVAWIEADGGADGGAGETKPGPVTPVPELGKILEHPLVPSHEAA